MTNMVECQFCSREVPASPLIASPQPVTHVAFIASPQPVTHVAFGVLGYQHCPGSPIPMSYAKVALAQHQAFLEMDL